MKKILLLYLMFLTSTRTSKLDCLKQILTAGYGIIKVVNDYIKFGIYFEKNQLFDNYVNLKNLFKDCNHNLPRYLQIDECVQTFIKVTIDLNSILIDVDQQNFDRAVLFTILEYGKLVQLNNYCLNSKIFEKLGLKFSFGDVKLF